MLKSLRLIISCLFLFLLIASCDKGKSPSTAVDAANENILRFDVAAPFGSLNPAEVEASGSTVIFPLLYSYLCVPDINGELKPDLAESWTYDPKTFTWIIHLRTDAFFHNGQPVTSKDVEYTCQKWFKNIRPSLREFVEKISTVSDSVCYIHLNKNDPAFIQKIWDMEIISGSENDHIDYYHQPVGSGPFQFSNRNNDDRIVLIANKNYYNGRPSLDGVVYIYQPDKEKAWTRLLSGATDIAQEISPKNFEMIRQYDNRFYFDYHTLGYYSILLYNTHDPLFADPLVRRALTHAIDREYIVKKMLNGYGKVAAGPMGIDSVFHNPELTPMPYDPQKSLQMLQQVGWSYDQADHYLFKQGKNFEFVLFVVKESQIEKNIAQYIKLCLNEIGIKMDIQSLPYEDITRRYMRNDEFQTVLTEFTGAYQRYEVLKTQWIPHNYEKSGAGGFEHPEVTRLLNKAIKEKDPIKQKAYLYEVDTLISSLQPGSFLFHKTAIDVMSRRFALPFAFSLSYEGIHRLRYASLVQK
ncbi:MAG: ABC transporter substrate-binding protein [Desulfosalsimonadaceae bacterium]|nr:ABC transporter substrate-binding protein [Desulfosalsimonadaceae bacterium]